MTSRPVVRSSGSAEFLSFGYQDRIYGEGDRLVGLFQNQFHQAGSGTQRDGAVGGERADAGIGAFPDAQRRQLPGEVVRLENESQRLARGQFRIELQRHAAFERNLLRREFECLPLAFLHGTHPEKVRVGGETLLKRLRRVEPCRSLLFKPESFDGDSLLTVGPAAPSAARRDFIKCVLSLQPQRISVG